MGCVPVSVWSDRVDAHDQRWPGNADLSGATNYNPAGTLQIDTAAPAQPAAPSDSADINGFVNAANDTTGQALTGTAEAGSTVKIYLNGASTPAFTTTANARGGNWSQTVGHLADGSYSYTVTATDAAGNTSAASTALSFVVDTAAPAQPAAPSDSADINGFVNAANDTTGQALTGTAEAGSTVKIYLNGASTPAFTTTANAGGNWSQTVGHLADGSYSYTVTATDAAGNTSAASTALSFVVDTAAPQVTITSAGGPTNQATQTITGTVDLTDVGATVTVLDGATPIGSAVVQSNGNWTANNVTLTTPGSNSLTAQVTDAAGNTGTSNTVVYTLNTTVPVITSIATSGSGISNGNGDLNAGHVVTLTVSFSETVTVDTSLGTPTLVLNDGGTATYQTGTGSNALVFSYTIGSGENTADLTVNSLSLNGGTIQDASANNADLSGATNYNPAGTLQIDTAAPAQPAAPSDSADINGFVNAANDTTGQALTGTAEAGSTVKIYLNGASTPAFTTTANAGGNWSQTVGHLADGSYSYTVTATDAAGNTSAASTALSFVVDTAAPAQPAAPSDSADINGFVNAANDTTGQALTGTAEAGSTVKIYLNGASTPAFTTTANAGGNWSQTVGHLADGSYSYTVTATDAAGNTSAASTALSFVVDTAAPAQPAAPSDSADINGFVNAANDTTGQALTGTAEAGSTVKIYLNGASTPAFTTTANAGGNWSQTVGHLADGSYSYTVTATDAAGNTSAASTALSFVVDTAAPQVTITSAGGPTNQATQTITGTVDLTDVGATVTVLDGATPIGSAVVQSNGNWTANNVTLTTPGSNSLTAQVTDAAGNTGTSNTVVYTLNTTVPVITSIATSGSGISNGNGDLNAGHVVTLTVSFSETVTVDTSLGTPTLVLNDGGTATYQTGTGSNALVFSYTIGSGENTADLTVNSLSLNGGTIQDASANNADLSGATNYNPAGTLQIDTAAPAQPAAPSDSADINGFVNAANDTTGQALTGTAEAGSTVKIYLNGASTPAFTTTANAGGNWSQTVGHLADGSYSYTVTATDAAGNTSAASTALSFVVDTAAPAQPAAPSDSADINGFVNAANDTTGQALTGTAEAGSTVKIYLNGASTPAFTTTANAGGNWSQTVGHLADGSYSYTVTATDAAGNTSAASTALSFVVDTAAPQVTITSAGGPTNQATQTITGTVDLTDVGATVTVLDGATPIGSAVVQSNGNWTANNVTLTTPGSNSLTAQVTDAAGNTGTSNTVVYTLNTTVPVITSIATSGSGISNGNGDLNAGHVVTLTVSFSETVTVDTSLGTPTLVLNDGGTATYQTGTGSNALVFSYTIGSGENTADLTVNSLSLNGGTIQDASANDADLSGATNYNPAGTLQIDTAAPAQPAAPSDSADINGFVNAANDTTGQALTGTAEAGSTVKIYLNGATTPAFTTTANAGGNWSQTVGHLADGSYSYTVTATDAAGNTSAPSAALSFVVDTAAPARRRPRARADINGSVNAANDTTGQALTGTGGSRQHGQDLSERRDHAGVHHDGELLAATWSKTVGHSGRRQLQLHGDGDRCGRQHQCAERGAERSWSTRRRRRRRRSPTRRRHRRLRQCGQRHGGPGADRRLAEAGSTVKIYLERRDHAGVHHDGRPDGRGRGARPSGTLADGSYSYTATATDAAGNTSAPSAALAFVVDTHGAGGAGESPTRRRHRRLPSMRRTTRRARR